MHFNRYIAHWSRRRPNAIAALCEGETLSWGQLERQSGALAAWFAERGVAPGERIGCLLENSVLWCVTFVAAFRAAGVFVPLNRLFGRFELTEIAADAECAWLVSTPQDVEKLGIRHEVDDPRAIYIYDMRAPSAMPTRLDAILAANRPFTDHNRSDDDVLAISYTSGTTGRPKGILLTHRSVDTMCHSLHLNFSWSVGDERFLILAPLAFTGTFICILCPMISIGASAVIEKRVDAERALDIIVHEKITYFAGVPALFERIASEPRFATADLSSIRNGNAGGAPVSRDLLNKYLEKGVIIRQQYGASEASGAITSPDWELARSRPDSAGHPLPTFDLEIRDADGKPAESGAVGEICIRGPQMMREYWRNPSGTAEAHTRDGWYRTGDLGRFDPELGLFVLDRKKNMLISGGVNIYPAEVERAIATLPGVEEVVVFGLPSETWGDEVVAIVHGANLTSVEDVLEGARDLIGPYKTPRRMVQSIEPLTRTVTGKVMRAGLAERFAALLEQEVAYA